MIITPTLAPTLSGLTVTPALRGNLLTWNTLNDSLLLSSEVWASKTNNRATATKKANVFDNTYMHLVPAGETWYYWIRAVSIYQRADGEWHPVSATGGISSTSLQTQTADIAPNAITSVSFAQSNSDLGQMSYGVWEPVFQISYIGSGNYYIIDAQHLANLTLVTIGSSESAYAQQRLSLTENTIYTAGTVSVTNGSNIVIGSGTNWIGNISPGKIFFVNSSMRYGIATVDSNTQITLASPYTGFTQVNQPYYVIMSSANVFQLIETTDKFTINGSYCISSGFPFKYRIPVGSTLGKLYDCQLDWSLNRDNSSWSIYNASVLRTVIFEEIKR